MEKKGTAGFYCDDAVFSNKYNIGERKRNQIVTHVSECPREFYRSQLIDREAIMEEDMCWHIRKEDVDIPGKGWGTSRYSPWVFSFVMNEIPL